jgi:hypothetical protein
MPLPNLIPFKKRNFMLKAEVTPGTDANPVGATDGFRLFDGNSSTEFDKVERQVDRAHFGGYEFAVANPRAKIEGEFEIYPPSAPGTGDADCAKLLLPCGMAVTKDAVGKTTRYNPISEAIPTVTAVWSHAGTQVKALGARGDISGMAIELGQRMKGKASLTGDYTAVTETAMPTLTLSSKVPVVASARNMRTRIGTLVKGGTAGSVGTPLEDFLVYAKTLSVDFGNALAHKEYSSLSVNQISDRAPTFTLRIARTDIAADFNPWFVRDNGILFVATAQLFETSGTPSASLTGLYSALTIRGHIENITTTDIDGDYGWELTGPCVPSDAGGDEFYLEFGDTTP